MENRFLFVINDNDKITLEDSPELPELATLRMIVHNDIEIVRLFDDYVLVVDNWSELLSVVNYPMKINFVATLLRGKKYGRIYGPAIVLKERDDNAGGELVALTKSESVKIIDHLIALLKAWKK